MSGSRSIGSTVVFALAALFACGIALASGSGGEKDWPRWRGQNSDSKSLAEGVFKEGYGLKVAWQKSLGSGYSSISIADGHAVTMFSDSTFDYVISLDAETGVEQWRYKIDSTYVGHDGSHNGPISTPVIDDGKVFALGPKGHLLALGLETGEKIWSDNIATGHHSLAPFYGYATSPLIKGEVLVVETGGQGNTISGFNKNTGKLMWATGTDTVNYQSPITISFDGEDQLVCVGDKYLYGLNPQNGEMYWQYHHNGGRQSINPVLIGSNRLFLNASNREATLIEIEKNGDEFIVKELWKTRETSRTFNTPVYHDGNLYGYTARFMVSLNAETGASNWKSRPPGDGFLILVDDHLVVITKRGALHIVKAVPDAYQEVASLQLFDGLTWTPTSFANGKIYARNLTEIAAVAVVPVDQPLAKAGKQEKRIGIPNSGFGQFINKVEKSENKKQLLDDFMAKQKTFPIIEDKKYAHFVYLGEAQDLAILGDMFETNTEVPMHRVAGTDFYYYSVELKPDARLNYRFTLDFDQRIPDPLNDDKVPSFFGEMSQVAMPGWHRPTHFDAPAAGIARGTLDSLQFKSKVLANTRKIEIYLPAGYQSSKQRYPVVYVNNGLNAVQAMKIPNTLDKLISAKAVAPVIAVFIQTPNSFVEYARQNRDKYAEMVVKELVPYLDSHYRTIAKSQARAYMGGDEGAYAAFYAAFKYPGTFSMLGGQSTHLLPGSGGEELLALVRQSGKQPLTLYLDWGSYDYRNTAQNFNWTDFNRSFAKLLQEKGYAYTGGEVSEGWGLASWRNRTDRVLETFFAIKKTQK